MSDEYREMRNDRGVALIMVLLVTALLIALIFEFAYGTRVSLRAAVNFRDSQRAYYLARSGVNFVGLFLRDNLKNNKPHDNLEQREWQAVPVTTGGDTELKVRWEDEAGKIRISDVKANANRKKIIENLFGNRVVSIEVLDRMVDSSADASKLSLLTGLHAFMSDEEYGKIKDFVTVSLVESININTASSEVLQSLGISSGAAGLIIEERTRNPIEGKDIPQLSGVSGTMVPGLNTQASSFLTDTSNIFKINSFATVGGYTKQVEAVITRSASGFVVNYWRAL